MWSLKVLLVFLPYLVIDSLNRLLTWLDASPLLVSSEASLQLSLYFKLSKSKPVIPCKSVVRFDHRVQLKVVVYYHHGLLAKIREHLHHLVSALLPDLGSTGLDAL